MTGLHAYRVGIGNTPHETLLDVEDASLCSVCVQWCKELLLIELFLETVIIVSSESLTLFLLAKAGFLMTSRGSFLQRSGNILVNGHWIRSGYVYKAHACLRM